MRKLFAIASCLLVLAGCKKEEEQKSVKFSVTPTTVSFAANDTATRQVNVTAENTDWDFTAPESWATVTRNGNVLSVSVAENTAESARETKITVTPSASGVNAIEVAVKQQGADNPNNADPSLAVSTNSLHFAATDAAAQTVTVTAKGGVEWRVRSDAEWIQCEKTDDTTVTINVSDAATSAQRQANVIVSCSNGIDIMPVQIAVQQDGLDLPASIRVEGFPDGIPHIEYRHFDDGRIVAVDKDGNFVTPLILTVFIEPLDATWTAEAEGPYSVYEGGDGGKNGVDMQAGWASSDERPTPGDELSATITVKHSDPNVEPFVFTAHKSAMEKTDLGSGGDDMNDTYPNAYLILKSYGSFYSFDFSQITLLLYDDGIVLGENQNQPYSGSNGRALSMVFYDKGKRDSKYPDDAVQLQTETFTIGDIGGVEDPNTRNVGSMEAGRYSYSNGRFVPEGTIYCKYVNGQVMGKTGLVEDAAMALAESGTLSITINGDQAEISWDFIDNNDHSIKGSYKGYMKSQHQFMNLNFGGGDKVDDDFGSVM